MSQTLMVSVSGMRGIVGTDLTPELVARQAAALGAWARTAGKPVVVLGRDTRTSGPMYAAAATAGLMSVGCQIIDLGISPTPTVQLAVMHYKAGAGLILTASHNPVEWNALKLVGPDGIFLDAQAGAAVRQLAEQGPARAAWDGLGQVRSDSNAINRHLDQILALPEIDAKSIRKRKFKVALDCVRGAGGLIIPQLLERLHCVVSAINLEADGRFPREPEPIGEDYTLAFAIRAMLKTASSVLEPPVIVANLSTSLVVEDAALEGNARFLRAPVGEANVARMMAEDGALIGGEGNGGVMLPSLHIGRDAPLGVALVLQYLASENRTVSALVSAAPRYQIVKAKMQRGSDLGAAYSALKKRFPDAHVDERDGLRLSWRGRWVHLRPSGTEPVVRFIAEAPTEAAAEELIAACRALLQS